MPNKLPESLADKLREHFGDATPQERLEMCWQADDGSWIIKHRWLEKLAAKEGIALNTLTVHQINETTAWCQAVMTHAYTGMAVGTTGEASRLNSKSPYPVATAEKRAIDRAILKLLEVHGDVISDSEVADKPKRHRPKPAPVEDEECGVTFDDFWSAYNYKRSKQPAQKAWNSLSAADREAAIKAVPAYVRSTQKPGSTGRLPQRAYAATWLNARRWEDEEEMTDDEIRREHVKEKGYETLTSKQMYDDATARRLTPSVDYIMLDELDDEGKNLWRRK